MKKILLSILTGFALAFLVLVLPVKLHAIDLLKPACQASGAGAKSSVCSDNNTGGDNPLFGPSGLITILVQILTIIIGIAAVVTIVIAGLRMVTSSGDPNTAATSRKAIAYAVAGLVIALMSQAMITYVIRRI